MKINWNIGMFATIGGAAGGLWAVMRIIPRLCASFIKGARRIVQFNDAIPAVLTLPQTLKKHEGILEDQNRALAEIHSESIKKMEMLGEIQAEMSRRSDTLEQIKTELKTLKTPRVQT